MNAMILAAGLGTRLGSLGRTLPKVNISTGVETPVSKTFEELHGSAARQRAAGLACRDRPAGWAQPHISRAGRGV